MMDAQSIEYSRYSEALKGLKYPLAYVDIDAFDRNVAALAARAQKLPIRLASKSLRCTHLIKRALKNPQFQGVLAYSGYEAVHLSQAEIDDIVVAYPIVQADEIRAVCKALKAGKKIVLMCDRLEHLALLAEIAKQESVVILIAIDIDVSNRWPGLHFGVRRSWIHHEARLKLFLEALKKNPELKLEGIMGYEAQIAGVTDEGFLERLLKKFARKNILNLRKSLVDQVKASGFSLRFVNGGGTGSLELTRQDPSVTELTAGSGLYASTLFDHYDDFKPEPAAGFALQVTRKPEDHIVTCFSGGYIASGSVGKRKAPQPFLPTGLKLLPHEGAGEVQTPLQGSSTSLLNIGDLVFFRHAKAGEYCERFNELFLISKSEGTQKVPTYRGEGLNFG